MSERLAIVQPRVSTSALERAAVRLHSGKHVEKLAAIDRELRARAERVVVMKRLVDVWRGKRAA